LLKSLVDALHRLHFLSHLSKNLFAKECIFISTTILTFFLCNKIKKMRTKLIHSICIISFILLLFSCNSNSTSQQAAQTTAYQNIKINDYAKLVKKDNPILLDVRTPEEFSEGAIPNSKNIDFYNDSFKSDIEKLDRNEKYLVYCARGGRSAKAAKIMQGLGFTEVYNLEGGYTSWKKNN